MMIRIDFLILIYRYIDSESISLHPNRPELNFGFFPIVYIAIRNLIGIINDLLTKL